MNIEFEAKFYINPETLKQRIKEQGGQCIQPVNLMKRWIFLDGNKQDSWVRVRDEGDKVTLSYKSFDNSKKIDSLHELEITVSDFEKTCQMIELLGYQKARYIENMREVWQLSDCLLMIDQWPALQPFVEVEGPGAQEVENTVDQLGLDFGAAYFGPTSRLYEYEYGLSQNDFDNIHTITFDDIPQAFKK